jgi:hypothetical protein
LLPTIKPSFRTCFRDEAYRRVHHTKNQGRSAQDVCLTGNVLKEKERDTALIAELDEMGALRIIDSG